MLSNNNNLDIVNILKLQSPIGNSYTKTLCAHPYCVGDGVTKINNEYESVFRELCTFIKLGLTSLVVPS